MNQRPRKKKEAKILRVDETTPEYLEWKSKGWEREINYIQLFYKRNKYKFDYQNNALHTSIKDILKCTTVWQNYGWVQSKDDFWGSIPFAVQLLAPKGMFNFYIKEFNDTWIRYKDTEKSMVDLYIWEHYWRRNT